MKDFMESGKKKTCHAFVRQPGVAAGNETNLTNPQTAVDVVSTVQNNEQFKHKGKIGINIATKRSLIKILLVLL